VPHFPQLSALVVRSTHDPPHRLGAAAKQPFAHMYPGPTRPASVPAPEVTGEQMGVEPPHFTPQSPQVVAADRSVAQPIPI